MPSVIVGRARVHGPVRNRREEIVSFLEKVQRCHTHDLTSYVPFTINGSQVGALTEERAHAVALHTDVFEKTVSGITMSESLSTPDARSEALAAVMPELHASGLFRRGNGEMYGVRNQWSDPVLLLMDRRHVPGFGVRAYGVHLNGYVVKPDGIHLWIGTRSDDRAVAPGKFDNMVAGGQPATISISDNLVKEADEEAALSEDLARQARATSVISYCFETPRGLRNDTLFCYDLEMPDGITPRNTDGEIREFNLMPLTEVLELVRTTDQFKFNVNLVIIDFAMRMGALTAENTPKYEEMAAGLRAGGTFPG